MYVYHVSLFIFHHMDLAQGLTVFEMEWNKASRVNKQLPTLSINNLSVLAQCGVTCFECLGRLQHFSGIFFFSCTVNSVFCKRKKEFSDLEADEKDCQHTLSCSCQNSFMPVSVSPASKSSQS